MLAVANHQKMIKSLAATINENFTQHTLYSHKFDMQRQHLKQNCHCERSVATQLIKLILKGIY